MTRQKLWTVLVLTSLLLVVMACTKDKPEAAPRKAEQAIPTSDKAPDEPDDVAGGLEGQTKPDVILRKWTGDLDGMIQRRLIRVLTIYSKTNYFVDRGTQRGLIYDAFSQFQRELNTKLKKRTIQVHVVCLPVSRDDLIPALLEGRGDIVAAGLMVTDARREQVDFTNPTRTGVSAIVVTGPNAPAVPTVEALAGREVYLQASRTLSTTSQQDVERFNAELARKHLPPMRIRTAPEVLADEDILEMVNAGLVGTTIAFDYIAEFWQQVFPHLAFNRSAAVKTDGQIAWVVRKSSPRLKAELNAFIARYPEGSVQRNVLFQKYLKSLKYVKEATAEAERAKFERTVALFRKYGDKYGLDYLLMMAQGYQESQLQQEVKGPTGAIGVMQVMPATGKAMGVGDITRLEPNVHAGVKYVRFMMDEYYANEPMDRLNKAIFTFASYNAGLARISHLRKLAASRGLDPNKWFNNVETLAAESLGHETVQYVANIYKYYLAYQMVMEDQERRARAKRTLVGR